MFAFVGSPINKSTSVGLKYLGSTETTSLPISIWYLEFEQEVKERKVADVPNDFVGDSGKLNKHAQAYFGLFKHLFDAEFLNDKALDNDKLVALAFSIDDVVNTAVAEYSINPAEIENAIHMKLLPMLFGDLGLDNAQKLIEEVLKITRLGLARG